MDETERACSVQRAGKRRCRGIIGKVISAVAAMLVMEAAQAAGLGSAEYWPGQHWRTSTPEAQGFSSAEISRAFDYIAQRQINIHSLVVIRHGYLVVEAYFHPCGSEDLHDICSCTKSVSSTLVGIAMDQGKIHSVKEGLADLFPGRTFLHDEPRKRRITLDHVLSMSSGMDYPLLGEPNLTPMREAPDMVQHVLDLPMAAEPGAVFGYNSGGSHLLSALVTLRTGQTAEEYARRNLFEPIGIRAYSWPTDKQGNSRGWGDLKLLSPDMARLGYLFLHKGRWNGRQIVSSRWVEEATRKHSDAPGAAGYGYQWWLRDDPPRFEALGRAGQRITVLPSLDAVVVFTGGGFEPSEIGDFLGKAVHADRLPEDPAAYAALKEKITAAARPPALRSVPPLSSTARRISGKRYLLEINQIGMTSVSLTFGGGETAVLRLGFPDRTDSRPVGLDGVYRVTRDTPDRQPDAVRGEWISESEFRVFFNEYTESRLRTAQFTFRGDGVVLRVTDPYDALDAAIRGTAGH